jgi:hypothetical protein
MMMARTLSEFFSLWVAQLMAVTIWISLPFAIGELRSNYSALRGQFGLGLCLIALGVAVFLMTRWFYIVWGGETPVPYWDKLRPLTLFSLACMAAGCLLAIRSMTAGLRPSRWIVIAIVCAAVSVLIMAIT